MMSFNRCAAYCCLWIGLMAGITTLSPVPLDAASRPDDYFKIKIVNQQGHGVPLIRLRTSNGKTRVTDSRGIVALNEPGLMGERVRFSLDSPPPGYEMVNPGLFGDTIRTVEAGETTAIKVRRTKNVARRLYRLTGPGIYRDSLLVGDENEIPTAQPLSTADVASMGIGNQAVFKGRLYWFWDAAVHLDGSGRFKIVGAVSELPGEGGLSPLRGVDLSFFEDPGGKTRRLYSSNQPFLANLESLMVTQNNGSQSMFAYMKMSGSEGSLVEHGILRWKESMDEFELVKEFPTDFRPDLCRNATRIHTEGRDWFYFNCPYPVVRVPAQPSALKDPTRYETFTPLSQGSTMEDPQVDENAATLWGWKSRTGTVKDLDQARLVRKGLLDEDEGLFYLTDAVTGDSVTVNEHGTVLWNEYRQKWVLVATQIYGASRFGEVWYAEADSPLGPWVYASRIVTHHQTQTLYNQEFSFGGTNQHSYFAQNQGETIFFSGLYANVGTNSRATSRYDHNILMYALNLRGERLKLPAPVYQYRDDQDRIRYGTSGSVSESTRWRPTIRFHGLPRDRATEQSVPVWAASTTVDGQAAVELTTSRPDDPLGSGPVFHALPPGVKSSQSHVVGLFEYVNSDSGKLLYSPKEYAPDGDSWTLRRGPIVSVWRSPRVDPPTDPFAEPVRVCHGSSAVCSPGS